VGVTPRSSRVAALIVSIVVCLATRQPAAQRQRATDLLDRYLRGDFEAVAAELASFKDFDALLKQLKSDGPAWIASGGPESRVKRRLAAATLALEAARADEWNEWKHRQLPLDPTDPSYLRTYGTLPNFHLSRVLEWRPPPLLIDWARQLFLEDKAPSPIERVWHRAAMAVAERAEDPEFLLGVHPRSDSDGGEITYLDKATSRFPDEPRFKLVAPIALDWMTWPTARAFVKSDPDRAATFFSATTAEREFTKLLTDPDVGPEAHVRLGALHVRRGNPDAALKDFEAAEAWTRDPYVVYLARYFAGQAYQQKRRPDSAIRAYRRALLTIPHAQSASFALAALLVMGDQRVEAARVMSDAVGPNPAVIDPWRAFADADDRFWPLLMGRLREEILK
jgi:tetratricopeptide (TPR) repeat protein